MQPEMTPQQMAQYIVELNANLAKYIARVDEENARLLSIISTQDASLAEQAEEIKQLRTNIFFYRREIYVLENELDQYRGY